MLPDYSLSDRLTFWLRDFRKTYRWDGRKGNQRRTSSAGKRYSLGVHSYLYHIVAKLKNRTVLLGRNKCFLQDSSEFEHDSRNVKQELSDAQVDPTRQQGPITFPQQPPPQVHWRHWWEKIIDGKGAWIFNTLFSGSRSAEPDDFCCLTTNRTSARGQYESGGWSGAHSPHFRACRNAEGDCEAVADIATERRRSCRIAADPSSSNSSLRFIDDPCNFGSEGNGNHLLCLKTISLLISISDGIADHYELSMNGISSLIVPNTHSCHRPEGRSESCG